MENIQFAQNKNDICVKKTAGVFRRSRPKGYGFQQPNRTEYGVALVLSGSAVYDYGDCRETAVAGDVLFLQKGENYAVQVTSDTPWEHIVISFKLWEDVPLPFRRLHKATHTKQFEELFVEAVRVYEHGGVGFEWELTAAVYRILALLLQETAKSEHSRYQGVANAAAFIDRHYKEPLQIETLAKISGYSVSHFSKLFTSLYGVSPLGYIHKVRIGRAKAMLRTEMFTLTEVAEACGFSNVYYFSRVFRKTVGVPPGKY